MTRKHSADTRWFKYDNTNPKQKHTSDCTVRAICSALELSYEEVYKQLFELSIKTGYFINDPKNTTKFLKMLGYEWQKQLKHEDGTKYTGKQFCEEFNKGTYIMHIGSHHISVVKDGVIHDIWGCSSKCVGKWIKIR